MKTLFVASAHYFALFSDSDAYHARARELQSLRHRVVTTAWVLTEVADGLAARQTGWYSCRCSPRSTGRDRPS